MKLCQSKTNKQTINNKNKSRHMTQSKQVGLELCLKNIHRACLPYVQRKTVPESWCTEGKSSPTVFFLTLGTVSRPDP